MSCRKATRLVSESLERPLRPRERLALRFHLVICTACRRFQRQVELLRESIRRAGSTFEEVLAGDPTTGGLDPEARARISSLLRRSGES